VELNHRFTVPIGVEETWAHFNDIASVAECFPGAQVTEADESSFAGSVKVLSLIHISEPTRPY